MYRKNTIYYSLGTTFCVLSTHCSGRNLLYPSLSHVRTHVSNTTLSFTSLYLCVRMCVCVCVGGGGGRGGEPITFFVKEQDSIHNEFLSICLVCLSPIFRGVKKASTEARLAQDSAGHMFKDVLSTFSCLFIIFS
jgi:hypothetical protein